MDCPDYSVFYYTYSTIAQTLAGAFGFLTAIALYQMQGKANMAQNLEQYMTMHFGTQESAGALRWWATLKEEARALEDSLWKAMICTGLTVMLCFILMP